MDVGLLAANVNTLDLRLRTSSLFQTAVLVSLHVDVSLFRWLCSLSDVGMSVLVICALGLNPIRLTSLNISEKETWRMRTETRGEKGKVKGVRKDKRKEIDFQSVFILYCEQF